MFGVLREYDVGSDVIDELVQSASEGVVPLICAVPGFVSYTMMEDPEEQGLLTLSTFEDLLGAEESNRIAARWVKDTVLPLLSIPPRTNTGRFVVRSVPDDSAFDYMVIRRYSVGQGSVAALMRRVNTDFMPLLTKAPGFAGYAEMDSGAGAMVALNASNDLKAAAANNTAFLRWMACNFGEMLQDHPDVSITKVRLHRSRAS